MTSIIASGDFTGNQKATTRATIQKIQLGIYPASDRQVYSSLPFLTAASPAHELPNLKSVKWDRSVDNDVGTSTLELFNTAPLPPGTGPATDGSFDLLGYYTYNRGKTTYSQTTWGHTPNGWQDMLVPDRVIRIYQGYGSDYTKVPELDPNLIQMGVYLIDDVVYTADGLITLTCRDIGRLLSDQIMFPPVVPFRHYPLSFQTYHTVNDPGAVTSGTNNTGWLNPTYDTDSGLPYNGPDGAVYGHHGIDAFDKDDSTFWLSIGNAQPAQGYSFEYVQGKLGGVTVNAVRCQVWGGPYRIYLSVKVGSAWLGVAVVPYDPNNPVSAPNGSNIPYVQDQIVAHEGLAVFTFPKAVANVTAIRVTFTDLYNSGLGIYPFRAGVRRVDYSGAATIGSSSAASHHTEGNYGDYSDIVKRLLAYGGFFWPQNGVQYLTDGNNVTYSFSAPDPYVPPGRVWGDIQESLTAGIADLTLDIFDKKPLLDGIKYVKDILGFLFFIDEQGAAVFRSPNTFKLGNWVTNSAGLNSTRTTTYVTIEDTQALISLRSTLSSRNLREKVFIGNIAGKIGAVANGRIPYPSGLRRVGGWTDQNFASAKEAQIMADLITLRQLFTFRQDAVRIPANPAIQCDDQVQIIERTTGEAYFHNVKAISSDWNVSTGEWTYDLTTSWLGTDPAAEWAFKTSGLSAQTQAYLRALGQA